MNSDESCVTILMAEDDDGHTMLVKSRLERAGTQNPVIRFRDGQEAWDFLSGASKPCLEIGKAYVLLLDIRMPRMDGIEVLRRVRAVPRLKNMPVVMLTTTDDPKEIDRCYELGCNNYLTKPVLFDKFTDVIKWLGLFLTVVKISKIQAE